MHRLATNCGPQYIPYKRQTDDRRTHKQKRDRAK